MSTVIMASMDDIVFRPRNKSYGAYALRKAQKRHLQLAFLLGASLLTSLFLFPWLWMKLFAEHEAPIEPVVAGPVVIESYTPEPEPPVQEQAPLQNQHQNRPQIQFVPPEVVDHEQSPTHTNIAVADSLRFTQEIGAASKEGQIEAPNSKIGQADWSNFSGTNGSISTSTPEPDPDPEIFIPVEKEAIPINLREIRNLIEYPEICKQLQIQGRVVVRVLIGKDGRIERHEIKKTPHHLMTREVEKYLNQIVFSPAIQAGSPIRFWQTLPIEFKLN